jgi:hypothetical protein
MVGILVPKTLLTCPIKELTGVAALLPAFPTALSMALAEDLVRKGTKFTMKNFRSNNTLQLRKIKRFKG